ncbi:receptor [Cichlidogyrus casuarinus]|uniref:Receptor n=1 Tax=Cichlidogyrus casuarinus TaxID=1844966 RepID=A0ABD2Q9C6_9PLAT
MEMASVNGPQLSNPSEEMQSALADCVQQIRAPFRPDEMIETGVAETLEQEYNRMETCIRRIIRVAKLMPFFNNIGKSTQLGLLRANLYGLIVLSSSFFFKRDIRKLCYPIVQADGSLTSLKVSMLDEVTSTEQAASRLSPSSTASSKTHALRAEFELYKANTLAAFDRLDEITGKDDILRVSLLAIKLFSEEALPPEARSNVSSARQAYLLFLWHYLRWNNGGKKLRSASELFERLLVAFIDLRTLEIRMTEFAKLLSLDGLSPLMREVCGSSQKVTSSASISTGNILSNSSYPIG